MPPPPPRTPVRWVRLIHCLYSIALPGSAIVVILFWCAPHLLRFSLLALSRYTRHCAKLSAGHSGWALKDETQTRVRSTRVRARLPSRLLVYPGAPQLANFPINYFVHGASKFRLLETLA